MDRQIIYTQEQVRSYDHLQQWKSTLLSFGNLYQDGVQTFPAINGFGLTYNSNLTLTVAVGRLYSQQNMDNSTYSSLPADSTQVIQQAQLEAALTLTFSLATLSSGQSLYALIEVGYTQADVIPTNDPTTGVLTYLNPANPTQPFTGQNNSGIPQNTQRQAQATVQIKYGTAATTGSQVPPTPDAGFQPLYLVLLTFGQTSITSANVFIAAPSVTTNVPSNYPYSPFIKGKNNFAATTNPGATNDMTQGYYFGSYWYNSTNGVMFVALVPTQGAAVWAELGYSETTIFTSNGNFTPNLSGNYAIEAIGGGGGGASGAGCNTSNSSFGGLGGSGGQVGFSIVTLTAGTAYAVVVGTAGTGATNGGANTNSVAGGAGGNTTFNAVTIAAGGAGGIASAAGFRSSLTGTVGGPGWAGGGNAGAQGGAGGSAGNGSNGNAAANNTGGGGGGGGGGGANASTAAGGNGGNGGTGILIIRKV